MPTIGVLYGVSAAEWAPYMTGFLHHAAATFHNTRYPGLDPTRARRDHGHPPPVTQAALQHPDEAFGAIAKARAAGNIASELRPSALLYFSVGLIAGAVIALQIGIM